MLHISCDICGRDMRKGVTRYCVNLDLRQVDGVPENGGEFSVDQLDEVASAKGDVESEGFGIEESEPVVPLNRRLRFDLCSTCYPRYVATLPPGSRHSPSNPVCTPHDNCAKCCAWAERGDNLLNTLIKVELSKAEDENRTVTEEADDRDDESDIQPDGEDRSDSTSSEPQPDECATYLLCPTCSEPFRKDPLGIGRPPIRLLILKALTRPGAKAADIASNLVGLYRALNEYHLAHGGTGLTIDDFQCMVSAAVAGGV